MSRAACRARVAAGVRRAAQRQLYKLQGIKMGRVVWAVSLVGLALGLTGCFKRSYDARPVVTFQDLGSSREDHESSDYRVSAVDSDSWRFPTRLAVVRVTVTDRACLADQPRLVFSPLTDIERPPWHECLRDIPEVGEVFFLQPTDFPRQAISLSEMAGLAGCYGARLCLIYAESDLARQAARSIGVLMDTRSGQILATLAAGYEPEARGYEVGPPPDRHKDDHRHIDPRYQAALKFRRLVHDCVLELKERQATGAGVRAS